MTWVNTIQPVLFEAGAIQIRWYGVMYALSFLLVLFYVRRQIRMNRIKMSEQQLESLLMWCVAGLLVGARIVEVLYYNPGYYWQNPAQIIAFWKGGLSFHGGLAGMIAVSLYFCRKHRLSFFSVADTFIVPLSLAQALGRFGNFTNHELFGRVTSSPVGVNFRGEMDAAGNLVYRHASQLYEAAYDIVIFLVLLCRVWYLRKHGMSPREGTQFALFLILYGMFRSLVEFFREPDFYIGPLTGGQLLNIPMILGGIILWIWLRRQGAESSPA